MTPVLVPMALGNDIITFFEHNGHTLFSQGVTQVWVSALAVAISIVIGLPIGAVVGHFHRFSMIAVNGGNVLRALPTLSIIAIVIGLYGLGLVNIIVALVILALPLILTNAYVAVDGVDPGTVRAAQGMGMKGWQILLRVELPSCVPLVMAGVRTAWVYVVATAYLAAFAGFSGTLGDIIVDEGSFGLGGVLAATAVAIVIAFGGELLLAGVQRVLTPRGLKVASIAAPA
ncbi:MAG: ABC transporter permease [Marmoricola sp.]